MVRAELIKRSPLRILEQSIHGELKPGSLGVISSVKGVGKTACLVHLATDKLFQGKHVIHVSFSGRTDHIISWYEDIFKEIARKRELESAMEVHDDVIKNRVIMNFSQDGVSMDQVLRSVRAMVSDGHFEADLAIVDGYDFRRGDPEAVAAVARFAQELGISVWFSASVALDDTYDDRGIPGCLEPFIDHFTIGISLTDKTDHVILRLIKDHETFPGQDLHLTLDAKTLLIAEDS